MLVGSGEVTVEVCTLATEKGDAHKASSANVSDYSPMPNCRVHETFYMANGLLTPSHCTNWLSITDKTTSTSHCGGLWRGTVAW